MLFVWKRMNIEAMEDIGVMFYVIAMRFLRFSGL